MEKTPDGEIIANQERLIISLETQLGLLIKERDVQDSVIEKLEEILDLKTQTFDALKASHEVLKEKAKISEERIKTLKASIAASDIVIEAQTDSNNILKQQLGTTVESLVNKNLNN